MTEKPRLVLVKGGIVPEDTPEIDRDESTAARIATEAAEARMRAERLKLSGKPEDAAEAQELVVYAERIETDAELPLNFAAPTETIAGEPPFGPGSVTEYEDKDLVESIRNPSLTKATAKVRTLRYAHRAGVLEDALTLADEIKAQGGIERMIAHQMAAAHRAAMTAYGSAAYHAYNASSIAPHPEHSTRGEDGESLMRIRLMHNEASARMANAGARMTAATVAAALTLNELRKGKRQKIKYVVEKHVYVTGPGGARAEDVPEADGRTAEIPRRRRSP